MCFVVSLQGAINLVNFGKFEKAHVEESNIANFSLAQGNFRVGFCISKCVLNFLEKIVVQFIEALLPKHSTEGNIKKTGWSHMPVSKFLVLFFMLTTRLQGIFGRNRSHF